MLCGNTRNSVRPSAMMLPQLGISGGMPMPRKLSAASVRMAAAAAPLAATVGSLIDLYEQKIMDSADMIRVMKEKEAQANANKPVVPSSSNVVEKQLQKADEEELRRKNLNRLLNRKKDRKAKSR